MISHDLYVKSKTAQLRDREHKGRYQGLRGGGNEEIVINGWEDSAMQDDWVLDIYITTLQPELTKLKFAKILKVLTKHTDTHTEKKTVTM